MSEIQSYDKAAGNNNSSAPDGFPEAQAPSSVNNSSREVMAAIARIYADMNGSITSAGTADVQTITSNRTITSYATGLGFIFKAGATLTNTGAITLNLNSIGAKSIKKKGTTDLSAGDITAGQFAHVIYDGTNFQLVGTFTSAADLKTLYESNADTNAFTDDEQTKLGIAIPSDTSAVTQTSVQITNCVKMTQTAYDAETPDASTLYIIVS